MQIKGWARTSLIDYPSHIATVFFTGGCNFRCPMCHNADLVLHPASLPDIDAESIWEFLEQRAGLITGVAITGGEPTLQPDLAAFLRRVRALGYDIKLDTNGYRPAVLKALLDKGLLNYVAMDVKAPPEKYAALAGLPELDVQRIEHSLTLIRESGLPYEFRTTVVPNFLDEDDIAAIAQWLGNVEHYTLQQFRALKTLDPALETWAPYPMPRLRMMAQRAEQWIPTVEIRGG